MEDALKLAMEILKPVLLAMASVAAGVIAAAGAKLIAKIAAETKVINRRHKEIMTEIAVEATEQTMPDASGKDKLAATKESLGKLADDRFIEFAVLNKKR